MSTRLGLYGGPRSVGPYAPKTAATPVTKGPTTRLGVYGGPSGLQGPFAPKTTGGGTPVTKGPVTRLGLYGGPRGLQGPFGPKTGADVPDDGFPAEGVLLMQRRRQDERDLIDLATVLTALGA